MKTLFLITTLCSISLWTVGQNADSASVYFQKGITEKETGRFKPALEYFQKSVQFDSTKINSQRELGLAALEIRQFEIAKNAFSKVLLLDSKDTIALDRLTNFYFSFRKWDDAIRYGLVMLELNIGNKINYIIGKSYYEKEDFGKAFRYLDAAYKEEPARAEIPFLFARALVEMSNYKGAVKYYNEAIALDTTKTQWLTELALAYSSLPNELKAIECYELALRRGHKADAIFMENLSNSYISAGMPERGIKVLVQLLEKRPGDLELLYSVADTYYRMGKFETAIEHWGRILQYDSEDAKSLYMIGIAYQKNGDKTKGAAICDKAISMDPSLKNYRQEKKL